MSKRGDDESRNNFEKLFEGKSESVKKRQKKYAKRSKRLLIGAAVSFPLMFALPFPFLPVFAFCSILWVVNALVEWFG